MTKGHAMTHKTTKKPAKAHTGAMSSGAMTTPH